jgi:hypothetical protein
MILTSERAEKLFNSDYIKKIYPMIDKIDVNVDWDGDEDFPFYKLYLTVQVAFLDLLKRSASPVFLIHAHLYTAKY